MTRSVECTLTLFSFLLLASPCLAVSVTREGWHDTFYQYRVPISFHVGEPGWHRIPITEAQITAAINALDPLEYRDAAFAYNYLRCVEVDAGGHAIDPDAAGGFYLVETGPDLTGGWTERVRPTSEAVPMFEAEHGFDLPVRDGDNLVVKVEPDAHYLLRYTTAGGGSPALKYEPIHPEGTSLNTHGFRMSYEPRLLPLTEAAREALVQPGADTMTLIIGGRFVNTPKDLSLRKSQIVFLADVREPGDKHWVLYYQPMGTHFLMVPDKRHPEVPARVAQDVSIGPAARYDGNTRYRLSSDRRADVWFAETTVKLTPETPVPAAQQTAVRISAARRERQSFQVVVSPRHPLEVAGVGVSEFTADGARIGAERVTVRTVEYVPVRRTSYITPTAYRGWIADPLTEVAPRTAHPDNGNQAYWITVDVPADAVPGAYRAALRLEGNGSTLFEIPLELTVRPFTLPEFSPFQTCMGGQYFAKPCAPAEAGGEPPRNMAYHGVTRRGDLQRLATAHYEVMTRNKFAPKNAALYTPIGLRWDPPPEGYNVDKPGNFFRLYDWDFEAFNAQLAHFIDELKLNTICIYHSNPSALNIFMHLPGKELTGYPVSVPFTTYAWQTYREAHFVGYDIDESHSYRKLAKDITRDQYDRLVLDFFRAMAGNLAAHGWLEHAMIMIDETHHDRNLKHFLRLMKSDPLTARIRIGVCVQGLTYFTDPEYKGLLDFYIPELDENYNRWEPFYFTDYGIAPDPRKLWNYVVTSARFAIDAPGINNRQIGLDMWQRGGSGYLCWDTVVYHHTRADFANARGRNPWSHPFTTFANGGLSFFYPPRRDTQYPAGPDFTVTPSLRMEIHREGVDDYEYAWLLERAMRAAEQAGTDVSAARAVFADVRRFFHNANLWSQNDAYFLELRERMAEAIERLQEGPAGDHT